MSFLVTAFGLTGMAATLTAGAVYGGLTTVGMNLIRGNDPFDNIGQGILMGGITGGIFGGAGGAAAAGEGTIAGGGLNAYNTDLLTSNSTDIATQLANNSAAASAATPRIMGTELPADKFGFNTNPLDAITPQQIAARDALYQNSASNVPELPVNSISTENAQRNLYASDDLPIKNDLSIQNNGELYSSPRIPANPQVVAPLGTKPTTTSPDFKTDPFGYLTHKDNRGTAMLGGLGLAGAMGAFNPKTGLNNLPPRTYQRVNTSYNPGTVNPKYGMPGEPYFVGQGYGPQTRETFSVAAGGGIRALSEGGYIPNPRGQMTGKEDVPTDLDDSAAFKRYLKSDINKKEEKGQAEIDANVMAWLKKYSENTQHAAMGGPIDGRTYQQGGNRFAEGGGLNQPQQITQFQPTYSPAQQGIGSLDSYQAPNVPAMESSPEPQYQMNGFSESPMFQPTGGNAPVQSAISEYIANMNQYTPPAAVAATTPAATTPAVTNTATPAPIYDQGPLGRMIRRTGLIKEDVPVATNTTSPVIYDPVTQRYSTNPNLPASAVAVENGSTNDSNPSDGGFSNNQEKAGGPIASKRYAMGGLAALPEYAAGGKLLSGDGDGMSDSIPAVIKGARPQRAALADGEFVIPADVVSHLGNGSTKAGGKRLYEMMANIRKARTGNSKQGKQINPMKFIPA